MRLWPDPDRIANVGLTSSEVLAAIRAQNVQIAGGQIAEPPIADRAFQPNLATPSSSKMAMSRAAMGYARVTITNSIAIPNAMYCASDIRTFRNAPLVSRSRCWASTRLSRHMFGSSQAYSGIPD